MIRRMRTLLFFSCLFFSFHESYAQFGIQAMPANTQSGSRKRPGGNFQYMTTSKYYLAYWPTFTPENIPYIIQYVIDEAPRFEQNAEVAFSRQGIVPGEIDWRLPVWGALYVNNKFGTMDQSSPKYVFGLLCVKRFSEAKASALKILEKDRNNFGATILLGLMSTREKELFLYLEKAFATDPLKTMVLIDWLGSNLQIDVPKNKEWDFLEAYIKLILLQKELFLSRSISMILLVRLHEMIQQKYYLPPDDIIIQGKESEDTELRAFRTILTDLIKKHLHKRVLNSNSPFPAQENIHK